MNSFTHAQISSCHIFLLSPPKRKQLGKQVSVCECTNRLPSSSGGSIWSAHRKCEDDAGLLVVSIVCVCVCVCVCVLAYRHASLCVKVSHPQNRKGRPSFVSSSVQGSTCGWLKRWLDHFSKRCRQHEIQSGNHGRSL